MTDAWSPMTRRVPTDEELEFHQLMINEHDRYFQRGLPVCMCDPPPWYAEEIGQGVIRCPRRFAIEEQG